MNRVTITVYVDIPDGLTPDVTYGNTPPVVAATIQTMDEPPLPDAPPPDLFQEAARIFPEATVHQGPATTPNCPEGHGPMKFVPAGVSKRNGKSYKAFYGCNNVDCKRTAQAA